MSQESVQSVFVAVPVDEVAARMGPTVAAQDVVLSLTPAAAGQGHLRYEGSWTADGLTGSASLDVARVSPAACHVEVRLLAPAGHRLAGPHARQHGRTAAAAAAVAAQLERRSSPTSPPPPPRGHQLRVAVPLAAAAVTLAMVAASAMLAPSPVTIDAATARYREAVASPATLATSTPTAEPPTTQEHGEKSDAPTARPARQARRSHRSEVSSATPAQRTLAAAETPSAQRRPAPAERGEDRRRAGPPTKVVPEPGVYRYATDGWEEVDVPGGHRRFPHETTQTVVPTDCGYRLRWDPLEERWDENLMCVRDGTPQPAEHRTYRSFFGRAVEQHFVCRPVAAPRHAVWAVTCASDDTAMTTVARPLRQRTMRVDGEDVEVSGLQVDSELEGANTGRRTALLWHAQTSGVLVRAEVEAQLEVDGPFGSVDYREQYTLHLASQTPLR